MWRRYVLLVALPLAFTQELGCLEWAQQCPEDECVEGEVSCDGNTKIECFYADGDPCSGTSWTSYGDCAERGMVCRSGECQPAPSAEPCPDDTVSLCRGATLLTCVEGRVAMTGTDCSETAQVCSETVTEAGERVGICALDMPKCADTAPDTWECQGTSRVHCNHGLPVEELPCDDSQVCTFIGDAPLCSATAKPNTSLTWVPVTGGTFRPGRPEERGAAEEVWIPSFEMLEREVHGGAFWSCVASGQCEPPVDEDDSYFHVNYERALQSDLPMVGITDDAAEAFCSFAGGRVPTFEEWEFAMRNGGQDTAYPWGYAPPDCLMAALNIRPSDGTECPPPEAVQGCAKAADITEQGVCDLVGNVAEWVSSGAYVYPCGGSYWDTSTSSLYYLSISGMMGSNVGFRCVR